MDELEKTLRAIPGYDPDSPLFELGEVRVTDAALEALAEAFASDDPAHTEPYLVRHAAARWEDLTDHEKQANLSAIEAGHEVRGRFALPGGAKKLVVATAGEGLGRRRPHTTVDAEAS